MDKHKIYIDMIIELINALTPFANFACDLEPGEKCECFNCQAKAAINKAKQICKG